MPEAAFRSFSRSLLGRTGLEVTRLGISAGYGVPGEAVERAFEQGVNYLYWGSRRSESFGGALRRLRSRRDEFVLMIQSYSGIASLVNWSLECALRALKFDYTDFLLLGMWNRPVAPQVLGVAQQLKARGLVRYLAVSTRKRALVPAITAGRDFDVVHFRYNAAHPGAEADIFPHLPNTGRPGMTAFTATSWGQLLGHGFLQGVAGSKPLPKSERVPTAGDCYRYVLSRPEVDACMTGPKDLAQMEHALTALRLGLMSEDELAWMRRVGRALTGK